MGLENLGRTVVRIPDFPGRSKPPSHLCQSAVKHEVNSDFVSRSEVSIYERC